MHSYSDNGYYLVDSDYVWDYAQSLYPTMLDDDSAYGAKYVFGIQTFHVFFPNKLWEC